MPKHSKRVAARQAALARRKKKTGPRPPVIYQPPPDTAASHAQPEAPAPVLAQPRVSVPADGAGRLPELELPSRGGVSRARPGRRPAVIPAGQPLPANPYLKADLVRIGIISGLILVVLIVLAFILG